MSHRTIMVQAHARRISDPEAYERVHLELLEAYQRDQYQALSQQVAAEIDREFHVELN